MVQSIIIDQSYNGRYRLKELYVITYILSKVHAIPFLLFFWLVHLYLLLFRVSDALDKVCQSARCSHVATHFGLRPHYVILIRFPVRGQALVMSGKVYFVRRLHQDVIGAWRASLTIIETQGFHAESRGWRLLSHLNESTLHLMGALARIF